MLEHILDKVEKVDGIDEIYVITNNKFYDTFRNWKRKFSFSKPISIINDNTMTNDDRLGAVGDIHFTIKDKGIKDDIFVIGGDNLFEFELTKMVEMFKERKKSVVALYDVVDKSLAANKYGVVELGTTGRIVDIVEKPENPKTSLVSTACYIFTEEVVQDIVTAFANKDSWDNIGEFLRWLNKTQELYGYVYKERWFDIGDKDQLKQADLEWSSK